MLTVLLKRPRKDINVHDIFRHKTSLCQNTVYFSKGQCYLQPGNLDKSKIVANTIKTMNVYDFRMLLTSYKTDLKPKIILIPISEDLFLYISKMNTADFLEA